LQNRLSTFFGHSPARKDGSKEETMRVSEWAPLVDIIADEKEYLVKVEIPEIKKEDVKVSVDEGVLTIRGERSLDKEEKSKKYHRVERAYGSFERSFTLPEDADSAKVTAELKDGVLRVHLPKTERAKPKSVEVKVG
jgi:HSP20 family protein